SFFALPSSALRGALCVYDRFASTSFFPKKRPEAPFVWVVNIMAIKSAIQAVGGGKRQQKGGPKGPPQGKTPRDYL
ncbi:hypothetical protein ACTVKL_19180, partial [Serratia marcescens]|uniref:hypothetical protein n=1 Tax=Serratia marcescens TaxID=615 RepID=UPI003FA6CB4F